MEPLFDSIIFDFDSTLITGESLDWLGEQKGMGPRIAALTARAMNGEVPLEEVMAYKMGLMNPSKKDLDAIIERAKNSLTPGANELVSSLHSLGKKVYILTSNFHEIVDPVAYTFGIKAENIIANTLLFNSAHEYSGVAPHSPLMKENSKAEILRDHKDAWGKRVFIGDSVSDARAIPYIERFIGFGGVIVRPKAKALCEFFVAENNLLALLPHLLSTKEFQNLTTTTTGTMPLSW